MSVPGAATSTQVAMSEKSEIWSVLVVELTVMTVDRHPGYDVALT